MPANATPERRALLELYGATIVDSPGAEGLERRGAARAGDRGARRPLRDALPVRERGEPARALRGHRRRDRARPAPRRRARRGPRHRRHADGHRRAPARGVPRRAGRRRRAAARRSGDGPALARGRLRAADPRRVEARPEAARLERRGGRRGRARCSTARGSSPASPPAPSCTSRDASPRSCPRARSSSRCSPTAAGSTSRRRFWSGDARSTRRCSGGNPGGDPRRAARARRRGGAERVLRRARLRDGVAERYVRGRNALASPYRYELEIDPRCGSSRTRATSSPSSTRTRRRSRSRRAPTASSPGLWSGRPFLIYGLKLDELRAWRVARDEAIELPLE